MYQTLCNTDEGTSLQEENPPERFLSGPLVRDEKRVRNRNRQEEEKNRRDEKVRREKDLKAIGATLSSPTSPPVTQNGLPPDGHGPNATELPAPAVAPLPKPDNVQPGEGSGPHPKGNEKANAHSQSPPSPASSVGGLGFVKVLVDDPLGVDGAGFENPQDTQNLSSDTRERDQTNLLDAAVRNIPVPLDTNSPATADNTTGSHNMVTELVAN